MSDNQKRLICRFIFLITCALPTSMVGYRLFHPETASQWETRIQSHLGVNTSIDSIETPGPYVTILRGLEFSDPEVGTLLDATEVKIVMGETSRIEIPHSVRMSNAGLVQLFETVNRHLSRTDSDQQQWQILFLGQTIVEDRIHDPDGKFPQAIIAENLQIDIETLSSGGASSLIQFRIPELDPKKWVEFRIGRRIATDGQSSHLQLYLNTNELELPCWLIGDIVPELMEFGPQCQFAGELDLIPHQQGIYGQLNGTFSQIQLPGIAESKAQVDLCRFNGGIEKLNAFLVMPDGSLSRIQETIEVVKRFDVIGAIRTAAIPGGHELQAENHR